MLPNSKVILSYFSVYAQLVRNLGLIRKDLEFTRKGFI